MKLCRSLLVSHLLVAAIAVPSGGHTQGLPDTLPAAAYAHAEQFLSHRMTERVFRDRIYVHWIDDGPRFWYEVKTSAGMERYLFDPVENRKELLVDRERLARSLSVLLDSTFVANELPLSRFELDAAERTARFRIADHDVSCDLRSYQCFPAEAKPDTNAASRTSPDGRWEAFIRDHDVHVRPAGCGVSPVPECDKPIRLTFDGDSLWSYGRAGSFMTIRQRRGHETQAGPLLTWSPDSRKLAAVRWDVRAVGSLAWISSTAIRPELFLAPQALPGDEVVERYDIHVIDVVDRTNVRLETEQIPWVRGGPTWTGSDGAPVKWSTDSERLFFLSHDRGPTWISLMTADARTGHVRRLVSDSTDIPAHGSIPGHIVANEIWSLSEGDDIYWYSERDGGSHIYRFDGNGNLRNRVTEGRWNVNRVLHLDRERGIFFLGGRGREPDAFPYHERIYRVRTDGTGLTLLTPEPGHHTAQFSPDGKFFVDTYSSIDQPPVTVLRSADDGRVLRELERADTSRLAELGWLPAEAFEAVAADGVTPIHGVMWKPTNFDSTRRYPILDYIYPIPLGTLGDWAFRLPNWAQQQALAELGFIVLEIQTRGTPHPDPAFRDFYRTEFEGRYAEATLPDHVAALEQLGARCAWLDLTRVGIYGVSGGGLASTAAMLRYPNVFKVGVSINGNHDDRSEHIVVGESWRGPLIRDPETGKDNYEADANYTLAANLKGKLLLMAGDLDEGVHPAQTLRLASALIEADRKFDLMIFPDHSHALMGAYATRMMFDYFVRHLLGLEPPAYTFEGIRDPSIRRPEQDGVQAAVSGGRP